MSVRTRRLVAVAFLALGFGAGRGRGPWESDVGDEGPATRALLHPGSADRRDLEGGLGGRSDQDWVSSTNASRHSYEARDSRGALWA